MYDFLLILIAAILGLLAHLARNKVLMWILRSIIALLALFEALWLINADMFSFMTLGAKELCILAVCCPLTILLLFRQNREFASWLFTSLDLIISGQILLPLIRKKVKAAEYFARKKIFISNSFPHLMALFIYITATAYLLMNINREAIGMPGTPASMPSFLWQFLSYNGIGLILLSFCGIGIYVSRSHKEALYRLGLTKPSKIQIGIAVFLIFASFTYDASWAFYAHSLTGQDLATQLSYYDANTFTIAGGFVLSVIVAFIATFCAGIGEEILIRGALQPVFGILPSALLQGILHAQLSHSPIFILKITLWSVVIGLIRRYTNTTTTIIAHAGLNLLTVFLFATNP